MFQRNRSGVAVEGFRPRHVESQKMALFMSKVYNWMLSGLAVTGIVSYAILIDESLLRIVSNPVVLIGAVIAELGLVAYISFRLPKMSVMSAMVAFMSFAAINGITISLILYAYTSTSVAYAFLITATAFGALSFFGYTTKKDLSALGTFLFIGLIGLIIASVVNMFLANSVMQLMISYIGVLIFAGLTAYDTQMIKNMAVDVKVEPALATKMALFGALKLYLDFINMFIFILQIIGTRRS
ncbi:MAG: Bax inhibitor-1/YccA family protein [Nitrospinota bacterium]